MSFLVELRNKDIEKQHVSAIDIFGKAIKKFQKAIDDATIHINKNAEERLKHTEEVAKRDEANAQLNARISTMKKSIDKINHIIGE